MDVCCVAHDTCYSNQYGKEMCDNTFCNCLSVATEHNLCAIDAAGFCAAARLFGQMVYDMAGGVVNTSPVVN
uniref:Phospholipase A(2) n=1 Tax=Caenorhabditis japonica TaxID=281687 RepID=A0A8R1HV83_CAEJA